MINTYFKSNCVNPVEGRFFDRITEFLILKSGQSDKEVWKVDMGERAVHIDQSVLFLGHHGSVSVTNIQHVDSAIFCPLISDLRQVANFNFFLNPKLKAFPNRLSDCCMFSYFTSEVNYVTLVNCSLLKGKVALQAQLYQLQCKCICMSAVLHMHLRSTSCMQLGLQVQGLFPQSLILNEVLRACYRHRLIFGKVIDL